MLLSGWQGVEVFPSFPAPLLAVHHRCRRFFLLAQSPDTVFLLMMAFGIGI